MVYDVGLRPDDRSISASVHLLAGASIEVLSFHQYSLVIDTHASEVTSVCSDSAQAIPLRGFHLEISIDQIVPTQVGVDSRSTLLVARSKASLMMSRYISRRAMLMKQAVFTESFSCTRVVARTSPC